MIQKISEFISVFVQNMSLALSVAVIPLVCLIQKYVALHHIIGLYRNFWQMITFFWPHIMTTLTYTKTTMWTHKKNTGIVILGPNFRALKLICQTTSFYIFIIIGISVKKIHSLIVKFYVFTFIFFILKKHILTFFFYIYSS